MSGNKINLLPKSRQRQLELRAWYVATFRVYAVATLSLVFISALLVGVGWYIDFSNGNLEREADGLRALAASSEKAEIREQVKKVNTRIADYNLLAGNISKWSKFLERFSEVVPPGVEIRGVTVDAAGLKVSVKGFAPSRELVIAFHDRIASASDSFANVDYPLENVARPIDISFHYTFEVKPTLIK